MERERPELSPWLVKMSSGSWEGCLGVSLSGLVWGAEQEEGRWEDEEAVVGDEGATEEAEIGEAEDVEGSGGGWSFGMVWLKVKSWYGTTKREKRKGR